MMFSAMSTIQTVLQTPATSSRPNYCCKWKNCYKWKTVV